MTQAFETSERAGGAGTPPDRNLALELVRVTEAAAMGAGRWIGRGDKIAADQAAVDGMRLMLDTVQMDGVVVIGEGEKDEAPMLFNGESIGSGFGPAVDVAVDPLEGTRLTALGQANAIAVIAVAERGTMFFPGAAVYMDKIATGPEAADAIDINATPEQNVQRVAEAKGKQPRDVTVIVLERDRHEQLIDDLREAGARVVLIRDGDVAPAIAAAHGGIADVDLLMGIGGTPEGVIAAAAIKCLGGALQGKLWPRDDDEKQRLVDAGYDVDRVLTTDDLVAGEDVFVAATGVTSGALLRGVRYTQRQGDHRVDGDALTFRDGPAGRGRARLREALPPVRSRLPLDRRRLHLRRVGARARGAVQLRAVVGTPAGPPRRSSPTHAFSAGACSARPYENESSHGCGPRAFIALRCAVASSSDWPPERKTIPGTAAGTWR